MYASGIEGLHVCKSTRMLVITKIKTLVTITP